MTIPLRINSLNRGRSGPIQFEGRPLHSAIGKRAVAGKITVGPLGLAGDEQADPTVHGGLAKAVYAYPVAHFAFWATVRAQAGLAPWGEPLQPGSLGEHISYEGPTEGGLWIGDRLRFAECVLVVSEPRRPCFKLGLAIGSAQAVKLMTQSGYCGAYLAVAVSGQLSAGDKGVLEPGPREVNLRELFHAQMRRSARA